MRDLSTFANMAEILSVIIVVGGLYFAVLQLRQFRQRRRELAAIEVFRFFGNHKFTEAYLLVLHLPNGLSAEDIRTRQVNLADAAMLICSTMEVIGVMTFQRNVSFATVDNLMGNTTVILWRKLQNWVFALRADSGNEGAFEWFQWLAERIELYRPNETLPAYEEHEDWVPLHRRYRK